MQAVFQANQIWQHAQKIPVSWIINSMFALCMTLALFQAANLTWSALIPHRSALVQPMVQSQHAPEPSHINLDGIEALHLFGESETETDLPTQVSVSSLNLKVTGILLSTESTHSLAVISNNDDNQRSYRIHERIEETNATLVGIFRDHVIIEHNGKQEIIMLEGVEGEIAPYTHRRKAPAKISKPPLPLNEIVQDPMRIFDYVRFTPKMEGDQIIGYELQPGNERDWFYDNGLNDGDVAVAVNGTDLTDDQKMAELFEELPTMSSASVTVHRNGDSLEIPVALN